MKLWDALMIAAVVAGVVLAGSQMVGAAGRVTVALPDVSGLARNDAESLARQVAEADVITSNCDDYPISDGEWTLLAGTGDKLAALLGMDPASYERDYYTPAFALLSDPASCDRIGPTAKPLIQRLIGMGGGTTPQTN